MNWSIRSRKLSELYTGLILLGIGAIGFLLARYFPEIVSRWMPICLFHKLSGIPCPACGSTRAGLYLSRLRFGDALLANPLFTFVYLVMAITALNALAGWLLGRNLVLNLNERERKWLRILILGCIPVNWLFLILLPFLHKVN
jgi:hypothetical protein